MTKEKPKQADASGVVDDVEMADGADKVGFMPFLVTLFDSGSVPQKDKERQGPNRHSLGRLVSAC
jgi:hypothetical protein